MCVLTNCLSNLYLLKLINIFKGGKLRNFIATLYDIYLEGLFVCTHFNYCVCMYMHYSICKASANYDLCTCVILGRKKIPTFAMFFSLMSNNIPLHTDHASWIMHIDIAMDSEYNLICTHMHPITHAWHNNICSYRLLSIEYTKSGQHDSVNKTTINIILNFTIRFSLDNIILWW